MKHSRMTAASLAAVLNPLAVLSPLAGGGACSAARLHPSPATAPAAPIEGLCSPDCLIATRKAKVLYCV